MADPDLIALIEKLRSDTPKLPASLFKDHPELAEVIAAAIEDYTAVPRWVPSVGQSRLCLACRHPYSQHFNPRQGMRPDGCRFCSCRVPVLETAPDSA